MKALSSSHSKSAANTIRNYQHQHQSYSIILVDDDSDIVHALKLELEANGIQVDGYSSPKEALQAFRPNVYDLSILDIRMPGLNGFQLYREMKKLDPTLTACFLSAFEIHSSEFQIMFPSLQQVKAIIKKPVSVNDLLRDNTFFENISTRQSRKGRAFPCCF